ncbi:amidohydrolase [Tellurirhabdus rosea]|uniref:amidohydrolase n=1 Tax=Tellurirhabdus rosea TaxID=2674997 RepID=UPI00224E1F02|nr:amidohydrolase [Tellurirhabdus rosea]
MNVTLLQPNLHWENPTANRAALEEQIFALPQATDLIVLPEMFTTGFTMNAAAVAEPMNLTTFRWLKQMAAHTNAAVTGSYVVKEADRFYNRLVWMEPDGTFDTYDKRHLFRMAGEEQTYTAGTKRLIRHWRGWNICPLICYDLRFPVWSMAAGHAHPGFSSNAEEPAYDLLLYVANWPAPRRHAWNTLLQARAIENLSYVVGVNRVGEDGNGNPYSGDSAVVDFKGEVLFRADENEAVYQTELSLDDLRAFRERFPAYRDADGFTIDNSSI